MCSKKDQIQKVKQSGILPAQHIDAYAEDLEELSKKINNEISERLDLAKKKATTINVLSLSIETYRNNWQIST